MSPLIQTLEQGVYVRAVLALEKLATAQLLQVQLNAMQASAAAATLVPRDERYHQPTEYQTIADQAEKANK